MRLPSGGLEQFLGAGATGSPQQVEDLSGFAAATGTRLGGLSFRAARGGFLRAGGLFPAFGFGVAAWG